MRGAKTLVAVCIAFAAAACAVPYREGGFFFLGYNQTQLADDIWRVSYKGTPLTSRETIQTYWLYRSAELTLEQGYEGFEVVTQAPFLARNPLPKVQVAASGPLVIPMFSGGGGAPEIEADIRLLHTPFEPAPPKVFNAAALRAVLEPYVKGERCNAGNVCPHAHSYLQPLDGVAPGALSTDTVP